MLLMSLLEWLRHGEDKTLDGIWPCNCHGNGRGVKSLVISLINDMDPASGRKR